MSPGGGSSALCRPREVPAAGPKFGQPQLGLNIWPALAGISTIMHSRDPRPLGPLAFRTSAPCQHPYSNHRFPLGSQSGRPLSGKSSVRRNSGRSRPPLDRHPTPLPAFSSFSGKADRHQGRIRVVVKSRASRKSSPVLRTPVFDDTSCNGPPREPIRSQTHSRSGAGLPRFRPPRAMGMSI